ncbi:MAG: hypothetical protein OHK0021_18420 [Bryobacter sp.]
MKPGRRTAARQLLLGFSLTSLAAADSSAPPISPPPPSPASPPASPPAAPANAATLPDPLAEGLTQLLRIRRLHVEPLTGGEAANQIRDMIIAAIQSSGLFALTENPERADAFLRGTAEDLVFTDQFQSSESLGFRSGFNAGRGAAVGRNSERLGATAGVSADENVRIQERKHEAVAAVRIVNKDGDVLWSTTQESLGAKFRGASADVAERITRQLRADVEKARQLPVVRAQN